MIVDNKKKPYMVSLKGNMTLGREYSLADTDIRVSSEITGRRHGEFVYDDSDDSYYYIDNNSTNGTFINGEKLQPYNARGSKAFKLIDGDIIRVDRSKLNNPHPEAVVMIFSRSFSANEEWQYQQMIGSGDVTIGRSSDNTICLSDMMASREHAVIRRGGGEMVIFDRNSQNGVLVNSMAVKGSQTLYNHDVIRIANTSLLIVDNGIFFNNAGEHSGALSVNIRRKVVNFGKRTLLRDIRFEADSGDFILILGGSGAGKTTLVNAILGDGKAEGEVILNGLNLYKNFKTMKSQIGLVPQFINLRLNDKVNRTLMDIAEIKLDGKFYSKAERKKRVYEVMEKVGITNLENHLICQLSGGQKKKVSVAAQLVGFQKVFICDEPDSGLDAASRVQQMGILKEIAGGGEVDSVQVDDNAFKAIADSGKIVMVISHEPDDAIGSENGQILFTKVLVLAKSSKDNAGHLAFYGRPEEALEYFGVSRLQEIMIEINPPHEGGKGRADHYINKYIAKTGGYSFE